MGTRGLDDYRTNTWNYIATLAELRFTQGRSLFASPLSSHGEPWRLLVRYIAMVACGNIMFFLVIKANQIGDAISAVW